MTSKPIAETTLPKERSEPPEDSVRRLCHAISGPLTSILVHCDLLLENPSPPDLRERLQAVQEEALRISRYLRAASKG